MIVKAHAQIVSLKKLNQRNIVFFGLTQTISNLDAKQTVDQFYEDAVAKV